MVIILAGCDGTGKSTCFNRLKCEGEINASFIKESYTDNPSKKNARALFLASKTSDNDVNIYDRATMLDDLVYNVVMTNKESELTGYISSVLISDILNRCLIIYFDLDDTVITERLMTRGDDYIGVHQVNKIKKCYEDVFARYGLKPVRFDVTGLSEDAVFLKVKEIINERIKNS